MNYIIIIAESFGFSLAHSLPSLHPHNKVSSSSEESHEFILIDTIYSSRKCYASGRESYSMVFPIRRRQLAPIIGHWWCQWYKWPAIELSPGNLYLTHAAANFPLSSSFHRLRHPATFTMVTTRHNVVIRITICSIEWQSGISLVNQLQLVARIWKSVLNGSALNILWNQWHSRVDRLNGTGWMGGGWYKSGGGMPRFLK